MVAGPFCFWLASLLVPSNVSIMKIKVVVHDAERVIAGLKFLRFPGVPRRETRLRSCSNYLYEAVEGCLSLDVEEV